jgi:hypothetical protein
MIEKSIIVKVILVYIFFKEALFESWISFRWKDNQILRMFLFEDFDRFVEGDIVWV